MNLFEKLYTIIIFSAVIIGIVIGQVEFVRAYAGSFIVPLLVVMLYITFLQIPLEEIKKAFKNRKFTYTSLLINFVWTPLLAWILALVFLDGQTPLYIGFIMLMVTPCTDWYLIFTGIAKGNVALSAAILPLNLILQVLLLPIYLLIFEGTTGVIEMQFLVESILLVLILPLFLAVLTNYLLKNRQEWRENLITKLAVFPVLFLSLAITAMFASKGGLLLDNLSLIWKIFIPVMLFFIINFFAGQKIGRVMGFSSSDRISLSLTTLARNSPIALAIAMTAFPDEPLIALTLVIGPLLELPILAVAAQVLLLLGRNSKGTQSL
ncbi:arsenic resistance protein [Rossellomorea vietnamensis]|uniref:Arsenic resistance protein n=2 Tax=Rossellomorea TaxID=2837508 RepID=A0A5D4KIV7_9BACI|nr:MULTISPECIES: bile acid:sodium symporter [Rossellomorea]TYR76896.1 arsenic resistance protein [Rossellomorea vietnamensis]TYS84111.1 arsenic resistance protein [Rossellomorea aquimaris]